LIDADVNLTGRYKNFDGKLWNNVKDLNEDMLFIHINISASYCMLRIASVMKKLYLPEDSVQIKLK
jgi:hypothetical protein